VNSAPDAQSQRDDTGRQYGKGSSSIGFGFPLNCFVRGGNIEEVGHGQVQEGYGVLRTKRERWRCTKVGKNGGWKEVREDSRAPIYLQVVLQI